MNTSTNKIDKKILIKQPYAITMAKHKFNVHEMRVMMRLLHALKPQIKYDKSLNRYPTPYEISRTKLEDMIISIPTKFLIPDKNENYKPLHKALENLITKKICFEEKDTQGFKKEIFTTIILEAEHDHKSGYVSLKISKKLIPHFLGLANNYSQYILNIAFNVSSANTIKLYQYFSHWRDKNQVFLSVETLKTWLQIENKYEKPAHITQRILQPCMTELKAKADLWFDIAERVKSGRHVVGWKFNIYTKDTIKEKVKTLTEASHVSCVSQSLDKNFLENKLMLSQVQTEKIISFFNTIPTSKQEKMKEIIKQIQWAKLDGKIHTSLGGYVAKVLNESFKGELKI